MATIGEQLTAPETGWQRVEQTSELIAYDGSWTDATGSSNLSGTSEKEGNTVGSKIRFRFVGTKLRILGMKSPTSTKGAKISIDGVEEIYSQYDAASQFQIIVFEKLGLENKQHDVEITVQDTDWLTFDAIDIDSDGVLKPIRGSRLAAPEPGWARYDDTDGRIAFDASNWNNNTGVSGAYNSSYRANNVVGTSVKFRFKGTKFRIIAEQNYSSSGEVAVNVDGVDLTPYSNIRYAQQYQTIAYEVTGLTDGYHVVTLTNKQAAWMSLDAIDVDDTGGLAPFLNSVSKEVENGWQRFDDTDSKIALVGTGWAKYTYGSGNSQYNLNSQMYTSVNGDSMVIKFFGSKIRFIQPKTSNGGVVRFTLDGTDIVDLNTYNSSTIYYQMVYERLNLQRGEHILKIEKLEGSHMLTDCIDIDSDGYLLDTFIEGSVLTAPQSGWRRYDDIEPNIVYHPSVSKGAALTDANNGTYSYASLTLGNVFAHLTFRGTKLRIIARRGSGYSSKVSIKVDGQVVKQVPFLGYTTSQVLIGEVTGLSAGVHTVELIGNTSGTINIDAIDIDADGEIVSPIYQVGDAAYAPQAGWNRYEDTEDRLTWSAGWAATTNNALYSNKTMKQTSTLNASIIFSFKGTGFRFLGTRADTYYIGAVDVKVDGVVTTVQLKADARCDQLILFEVTGLEDTFHRVEIVKSDNIGYFLADAFDIQGTLYHKDEVTSFEDLTVGKRVRINYATTASNQIGSFYLPFEKTGNLLTPAATVNGDLYFIAVGKDHKDRWILVADRPVQNTVTWDTLNNAGFATKSGVPIKLVDAVPALTDYTGPNGQVISSGYYNGALAYHGWKVFDKKLAATGDRWSYNGKSCYIGYMFNRAKILYAYTLRPSGSSNVTDWKTGMPKDWTFEGSNDGVNWTILDTQTEVTDWLADTERQFAISTPGSYLYYRVNVSMNNGGTYTTINEIRFLEDTLSNYAIEMRLLTGGTTTTDKDNDWDRYIVQNTLDGLITPGDSGTWYYNNVGTWTATPVPGTPANRVDRGYTAATDYGASRATTYSAVYAGFRPLMVVETLNKLPDTSPPTFDGDLTYSRVHDTDTALVGTVKAAKVNFTLTVDVNGENIFSGVAYETLDLNVPILNSSLVIGDNTVVLTVTNQLGEVLTKAFTVTKTNTPPIGIFSLSYTDVIFEDVALTGTIDNQDGESDLLAYEIKLNEGWIVPFTVAAEAPLLVDETISNDSLNLGLNRIEVNYVDEYGAVGTWVATINKEYIDPEINVTLTRSVVGEDDTALNIDIVSELEGMVYELTLNGEVIASPTEYRETITDSVFIANGRLLIGDNNLSLTVTTQRGHVYTRYFVITALVKDTTLFEVNDGLLFTNSRWLSARLLTTSDSMQLTDIPAAPVAIEVFGAFTDEFKPVLWKNSLETYSPVLLEGATSYLFAKRDTVWDIFAKSESGYVLVDSTTLAATKFGAVGGSFDKVLVTKGTTLTVVSLLEGFIVKLEDVNGNLITEGTVQDGYSGVELALPGLEFNGALKVIDPNDGNPVTIASIAATFYGGDVYSVGSDIQVRLDGVELSRTTHTDLGQMTGGQLQVRMELYNPSFVDLTEAKVAISSYSDKFGWQWADVALDVDGAPGAYVDEITVPVVPSKGIAYFWVKVTRGENYYSSESLQFNLHLVV